MNYNERILQADFMTDGRGTLPRHPTKEWGKRDPGELKGVCFHQSLEQYGSAKGNARYHAGPNHISESGLPGLSYTLFVERDGNVILANGVEEKTYSQGYKDPEGVDENALYIGVCFGGHFSGPGHDGTQKPSSAQMDAAMGLWAHLSSIWEWGPQRLFGHFDFGKPACPGYELMEFVKSIRPVWIDSIIEKQKFLAKAGFYRGDIDGLWGPLSKAALVEFQRSVDVQADGVWGRNTTRAAVDWHG